jgi:glycosyltransferase involved in cell wall biosynthesis
VDPLSFRDPEPQRVNKLWQEFGINQGDPVLLTVARLDPPKGHRFLFSALSAVRRSYPAIKLLVVGDGPSRSSLEALCRDLDLNESIVFTGTRFDVPELLAIANVFVLPTLSEGMPLTLLEALAAGVPTVMSRIGPIEEVIVEDENGILVPPRSPSALANGILRLLNYPEKAQAMGERGKALVNEKFSANRSAKALTSLYETLAMKYAQ